MATKTKSKNKTQKQMDALEILMADHANVEQLFQRAEQLTGPSPTKASVVRKIIKELSVHATVEEQLLYPIIRNEVNEGAGLAGEAIDEHLQVKEALADLQGRKPDDEQYETLLASVIEDVRHHVEEEETELFPKIRAKVSKERLLELGAAIEQAKKMAPTRPHPEAPTEPPANVIVGVPTAAIDRVIDLSRGVVMLGLGVTKTLADVGIRTATKVLRRVR